MLLPCQGEAGRGLDAKIHVVQHTSIKRTPPDISTTWMSGFSDASHSRVELLGHLYSLSNNLSSPSSPTKFSVLSQV